MRTGRVQIIISQPSQFFTCIAVFFATAIEYFIGFSSWLYINLYNNIRFIFNTKRLIISIQAWPFLSKEKMFSVLWWIIILQNIEKLYAHKILKLK